MKQPIPPDSELTIFTETEIQDRGIGEYLSSGKYEFLIRTGEKEEGDFLLLKNIINGMKVTLTFNKAIRGIPYSQLHERLQLLQRTHALSPLHYSRDALCSGIDSKRTIEILQTDDVFRPFIELLERKMKVYSLWVVINTKGDHPFHADSFRGGANYRNLITFGGRRKRMWFFCTKTKRMCGIVIPHNAFVTLNKFGGGMLGTIIHCVTKAENSYLIAFETA
jgi:hypothetical protein